VRHPGITIAVSPCSNPEMSLQEALAADGYDGDLVVEMEVADRENTLRYLADAVDYIEERMPA